MKRIILGAVIGTVLFSLFGTFTFVDAQIWRKGMRSEEIRALQEILKEDPEIYPEGYVTGYFGSLTEKAIKRLQEKLGLEKTGIFDEKTKEKFFPSYKIRVIFPNGGEVLDRREIHTIKWELPPVAWIPEPELRGFWPKVSIDLFKRITTTPVCPPGEECGTEEKSIFVKHIAFVPFWKGSYSWKISSDIPNDSNYVIRITLLQRKILPCIVAPDKRACLQQKLLPVPKKHWDESDGTFTIVGQVPPPNSDIKEVIKILKEIAGQIERAIAILEGAFIQ